MKRIRSQDRHIPWTLIVTGVAVLSGTAFFPMRENGEVRFLVQVARDRVLGRGDAVYSGIPAPSPEANEEPASQIGTGTQTAR